MDINVKIEISLRDKGPIRLSSDVLNELKKIVKTSLANYMTLQSREITVWYGPRGSKVSDKYYMFDIYLFNSSDTIDFSASVKEIRSFFKSLKTHDSIRILNGDEIMIEINFNHRLVPKLSQYYDMSVSGGGSLTVLEGRTLVEVYDRPSMLISNVNWCSRVPLDIDDEAERIGMDVLFIKPVGRAVYNHQYDEHYLFLPEIHLLYVCLDLFIRHSDNDTFDITDDDLMTIDSNINDDDEKKKWSVPVFIAIITVCLCLFVVCALCNRRSTPTNMPTIQPEIHVSPDMGIVSDARMSEDGMQYAGMVNRTLDLDATDVDNDVSETEPNSNVVADKRVHP